MPPFKTSLGGFLVLFVPFVVNSAPAADPTYWQDVRPIFRKHCTVCHQQKNVDEVDVSGGLALDTFESAMKGARGPVVRAGTSAESRLIKTVVHTDEKRRMPPGSPPLPEEAVALLRKWIDAGAKEGTKPAVDPLATTDTPVRTRKLDVVLPTTHPAKLDLVLKEIGRAHV